ncbi:MAG: hypothetical protein KIS76_05340 [Pyrinomonadaceae bacterium]|nr:hypothetical protein [Pyrinomonadaceae bacterium]
MKLVRSFLAANLIFSLVFVAFLTLAVQNTNAQNSNLALQRGYRTGYSDGYMDGYRDVINNATKNFSRHEEYAKADRAYIKDYGTIEDYRDGYQQGFEIGYAAGFEKRGFDATLPTNLTKRGIVSAVQPETPAVVETAVVEEPAPVIPEVKPEVKPAPVGNTAEVTYEAKIDKDSVADKVAVTNNGAITTADSAVAAKVKYQYPAVDRNDIIIIPANTELVVELQNEITTDTSREGDKFTAIVVSPSEISGAVIEGRVDKIRKPGRIKRRAEILLSFDRIILAEDRWSNFNAIVTDVLPSKGDNVKRVDMEGTVEGDRPYKDDAVKIGAATGTGLIVGAIAAGPVGAGVGAAVGAAFGVGAVVVDRGEHINLRPNQQIRIKSSYETQIR